MGADLKPAYTILLIDDEQGIRNVLHITLAHAGFRVVTAADGETGLSIFKELGPEIVITDIKMPGIDGIEVLRQVKKTSPETEVIMITGHGDMDLAVKSLQWEAADFITKPIDSEALEASVKKARDRIAINTRIKIYMKDLEGLVQEKDHALGQTETLATIGQAIAGMSHVIKNIAGGLKGSSFILEQGIQTENREYLVKGWEMMKKNLDKITQLSLDLLNFAKTGTLSFKPTPVAAPVKEAADLLAPKARQTHTEIEIRMDGQAITAHMDPEAMGQVLFNLISNALDAVNDDEQKDRCGRVTISAAVKKDRLVYAVKDTGPGIDGGVKKALFQKFITTKGTAGTGFGLMTSKRIVEGHGGRIWFATRPDTGTVFFTEIPLGPERLKGGGVHADPGD